MDKLFDKIRKFLADHRESEDGGWARVTKEDRGLLHQIVLTLIELKFDRDPDGDLPVEFDLVNRNAGYMPPFQYIPYHTANDDAGSEYELGLYKVALGEALYNLSVAMDCLRPIMKNMQYLEQKIAAKKYDAGK